ncbi:adenylate/guanylate cyclase domain-containing protein [soil metagenome]
MSNWRRHRVRIVLTLLPVAIALLHAAGIWRLGFIDRLDYFIYDVRLRATMPRTLDPRVVIVDIDDASLRQFGQWPWSRDKLARLSTELLKRQQVAVLGYDVMFAEPDDSAGLASLRQLASGSLRNLPTFAAEVERLAPALDHDAAFARALDGQPVVLGYYFTQDASPTVKGSLPEPVLAASAFPQGRRYAPRWNGFGAVIAPLAQAVPSAGFLNFLVEDSEDGVVRSSPLLGRYDGDAARPGYYESLALSVFRLSVGSPPVTPLLVEDAWALGPPVLEALLLGRGSAQRRLAVDAQAGALVPFRGPGGARGGSFRYVAAADVLNGGLAPCELKGRIVLVGATAPGLQDLRATPAGPAFPGVEVHANILSGLLDGRLPAVPDYAKGYDVVVLLVAGLLLAFGLSLLSASRAVLFGLAVGAALIGLNSWLYLSAGLVMPLAAALVMTAMAFVLNTSWSYLVEARGRRGLARLFGTYVPPQLVAQMLEQPERYSMRAESKELTVMFCDMRGFTRLSEHMAPVELQTLLNGVFSRLTEIITRHRGTVDKYMGDCVMAFWGAPVDTPEHATLAVQAAIEMAAAVREIDQVHRMTGRPGIGVGIGLNTGTMSVGDMGSALRRSYTVVGDAVNLASRLEGLSSQYGVQILATDSTQRAVAGHVWQELDSVYVRGREAPVAIFTPVGVAGLLDAERLAQLDRWAQVLAAYRAQRADEARELLAPLLTLDRDKILYQVYAKRLASMAARPEDPAWDGSTRFETK